MHSAVPTSLTDPERARRRSGVPRAKVAEKARELGRATRIDRPRQRGSSGSRSRLEHRITSRGRRASDVADPDTLAGCAEGGGFRWRSSPSRTSCPRPAGRDLVQRWSALRRLISGSGCCGPRAPAVQAPQRPSQPVAGAAGRGAGDRWHAITEGRSRNPGRPGRAHRGSAAAPRRHRGPRCPRSPYRPPPAG